MATIIGTSGSDTLHGSDGDVVYGGAGDDHLFNGSSGKVTMHGGAGNDSIDGIGGEYLINGGSGNDEIGLMGGKDTLLYAPGSGHDRVGNFQAFATRDLMVLHGTRFTSFEELMAATVQDGEDAVITIDENTSVRLWHTPKSLLQPGDFQFVATPLVLDPDGPPVAIQITGTAGNDTLLGTVGRDTIDGLAGDDFIDGGAGSDIITPGAGNDTIVLGLGYGTVSLVAGGAGNDTVQVSGSLDEVAWVRDEGMLRELRLTDGTLLVQDRAAGSSFHALQATGRAAAYFTPATPEANRIIAGGAAGESLQGGIGDDILYGHGGADTLAGGAGNDYLGAGDDDGSVDSFDGGEGTDTLGYAGTSSGVSIYVDAGVALGNGTGRDTFTNIEAFAGSTGGDVLVGRQAANDLRGLAGDDWLYGYAGNDSLSGGDGVDVLVAGEGNDTLDGGAAQDYLYGYGGTNVLRGGAGVDVLISQGTNDTLSGGADGDYLYAYGNGVTVANGEDGNDIFVMQSGPALADGGEGQDYFYMGAFDDTMTGGAGVDVMLGGGGNDVYDGGAGTDYLFLGEGSSVVRFRAGSGVDVIHGFKAEGAHHVIRLEGTHFADGADLLLRATMDYEGNALIYLDSETVIWVVGVTKAQLAASDFAFA